MKKTLIWITLVMIGGLLWGGCTANEPTSGAALIISDMTAAVGSVDESTTDQQTLTFSLTLLNRGETPIFVRGIDPRPTTALQQRLLNETTFLPIDQTIAPGETIEVGRQWLFQTPGMTKEEIDAAFADGYFAKMQATVEMELSLSGGLEE